MAGFESKCDLFGMRSNFYFSLAQAGIISTISSNNNLFCGLDGDSFNSHLFFDLGGQNFNAHVRLHLTFYCCFFLLDCTHLLIIYDDIRHQTTNLHQRSKMVYVLQNHCQIKEDLFVESHCNFCSIDLLF